MNEKYLNASGQYGEHHFSLVGDIDEFRDEKNNKKQLVWYILGSIVVVSLTYLLIRNYKK